MTRSRYLVVSIHDVAPAYWSQTKAIVEHLDGIGVKRQSLLVIPNFRGREPISENLPFLDWLRERRHQGDEILLHGYEHVGVGTPVTIMEKIRARWQTQGEGEFLTLTYNEASRRIKLGMKMLGDASIEATGFVAPAWMINPDGLRAATDLGFQYTNNYFNVQDLTTRRSFIVPSLVFGPGALNEDLGIALQTMLSKFLHRAPVLRVILHPPCVENPARFEKILSILKTQRLDREPITYSELLNHSKGSH